MPAPLFWRHIERRTGDCQTDAGTRVAQAGQAKIRQQYIGTIGVIFLHPYEKVRGLHIAVNDLLVMRVLERVSRLLYDVRHIRGRE